MGFCSNGFKTSCITSHLHYNYIFMHFRCVRYMLNSFCAVRIGLGWAHDVYKFACHMFMHFHAYVPLFLYILIYYCCWYLFYCLFLFFSLFLALVCSMALKCKSTSFRNPLRSKASSSSFPSAITRILLHFSVSFPASPYFSVMGAIDRATVRQSKD